MTSRIPSVYLETTALKFAVDRIGAWASTEKTVNWGGREFTVTVHEPAIALPNEELANDELKNEARLLPRVAELSDEGRIELLVQQETLIELWGLPRSIDQRGLFYGAPIKKIAPPFEYGRIVFQAFADAGALQYDFLSRISEGRFLELQKACGAYQGSNPPSPNQLRDAFHVWCAEAGGADFFLTYDLSLVRYVGRQKRYVPKVRVVKPSELLVELAGEG